MMSELELEDQSGQKIKDSIRLRYSCTAEKFIVNYISQVLVFILVFGHSQISDSLPGFRK